MTRFDYKLVICIALVNLLTTTGISITYYVLTRQDKRASRQQIQIAFNILLE